MSKKYDFLNNSDTLLEKLEKKFITNPPSPYAVTMDEWDDIHARQRKNHPIAYCLLRDLPDFFSSYTRKIKNALWWVKYRTVAKHKYYLIDTKLSPGYHEYDTRILHGVFSLFVEMVKELGENSGIQCQIDWYTEHLNEKTWGPWEKKQGKEYKAKCKKEYQNRLKMWGELQSLHQWWTFTRAEEHAALESDFNKYYDNQPTPIFSKTKSKSQQKQKEKQMADLDKLYVREEALTQKDDDNLQKLIKYRRYLWV